MPDAQSLSNELTAATLAAIAAAGVYQTLKLASLHSPANPLPAMAVEGLGLRVPKGGIIPRPTPLIVTWVAPQPIGITPPHYFGLPEDYFFGHTPHEVFDFLTGEKAKQGTEARAALNQASTVQAQLSKLKGKTELLNNEQLGNVAAALAKLDELRAGDPFFANRLDPLIGLNAEVAVEVRARAAAPIASAPADVDIVVIDPPPLRVPAGVLAFAVASALNSENPPDP